MSKETFSPADSGRSFWRRTVLPKNDGVVLVTLTVILCALYLPNLGSYGLFDPWETHYGEVARNMVENANYIDPFWGSPWDTESVKRERAGFYSKPPLTMWLMAGGLNLFGFTELGVRFFFPILMILALLATYMAIASLYDRRTAIIAITILGTCPFVVFLARQAVTDGPLVAIMTIAMMALSLALCDPRHRENLSPFLRVGTCALFLLVAVGQLWIILPLDRSPDVVRDYPGTSGGWFAFQWWIQSVFEVGRGKGWFLRTLISPLVVWAAYLISRLKTNRSLLFASFTSAVDCSYPRKAG